MAIKKPLVLNSASKTAQIASGDAIGVTSGGTGLNTVPANGEILVGNGSTYTKTTITAGGNIVVTNAAGSVTIAATNPAGATGNPVFYENDTNVTASYTITSGKNAMSAGPITVNNGVTVTIPNGSTWTVV